MIVKITFKEDYYREDLESEFTEVWFEQDDSCEDAIAFTTPEGLHRVFNTKHIKTLFIINNDDESTMFNHMLDVAFTIETPIEDWEDIPPKQIYNALQERIDYLVDHPEEACSSIGHNDSFKFTKVKKK